MKNASQEFGLFIDNLRSTRNISREEFVDGILSTRQFQRYLKGESSISNEKILKLVDKIELDFFSVYNRFLKSSNIEHQIVNQIYDHIMALEYKDSYELIQEYKNHTFTSAHYRKLFDLYDILTRHKLLRISTDMAVDYFENIIDYPKCMKNEILNFIELTALIYIAQIITNEQKKKKIMLKLYDILKYHKISDFNVKDGKMAVVYSVFAKLLGTQEKYPEVIYFTKKGIELCELNKTTNSLAHLYYYCALGYMGNNNMAKALSNAKKAFFVLELENSPLRYKEFVKKFESHFNIKFSEFKTW